MFPLPEKSSLNLCALSGTFVLIHGDTRRADSFFSGTRGLFSSSALRHTIINRVRLGLEAGE
jgi:hypothetical protein